MLTQQILDTYSEEDLISIYKNLDDKEQDCDVELSELTRKAIKEMKEKWGTSFYYINLYSELCQHYARMYIKSIELEHNVITDKVTGMNSFSQIKEKDTIRVLTFQSPEVVNILRKTGKYKLDKTKCREQRAYKAELEQYGYESPIWLFTPLGLKKNTSNPEFCFDDFKDATLFHMFKCEMSLNDLTEMNKMYMIELEVNKSDLRKGITHNGASYVQVINGLTSSMVKGIYRLHFLGDFKTNSYIRRYHPKIQVCWKSNDTVIFNSNYDTIDYYYYKKKAKQRLLY